jgi:hypothetical protein
MVNTADWTASIEATRVNRLVRTESTAENWESSLEKLVNSWGNLVCIAVNWVSTEENLENTAVNLENIWATMVNMQG